MVDDSAYFKLDNVDSKRNVKEIKCVLDSLPRVASVGVNGGTNQVVVDFDSTDIQSNRIQSHFENPVTQLLNLSQIYKDWRQIFTERQPTGSQECSERKSQWSKTLDQRKSEQKRKEEIYQA